MTVTGPGEMSLGGALADTAGALTVVRSGSLSQSAQYTTTFTTNNVIAAGQTLEVVNGLVSGENGANGPYIASTGTLQLGSNAIITNDWWGNGGSGGGNAWYTGTNGTIRFSGTPGHGSAVGTYAGTTNSQILNSFAHMVIDPGAAVYWFGGGQIINATPGSNSATFLTACKSICLQSSGTLSGGNLVMGNSAYLTTLAAANNGFVLTSSGSYSIVAASNAGSIGFAADNQWYAAYAATISLPVNASSGNGGLARTSSSAARISSPLPASTAMPSALTAP